MAPTHGLTVNAARLRNVAQALTMVGAVDHSVAEAILANFELAVAVRQSAQGRLPIAARPVSVRRRVARLIQGASPQALSVAAVVGTSPGPLRDPRPASPPVPDRVVPVGMMVPVRDEQVRGELYLMAFSQTANGARFGVHAWLREALSDMPPHGPIRLLRDFTATDDQGNGYSLAFAGRGTMAGWDGLLVLDPPPPPGVRWLDLTAPGGPTRRISLAPPARVPAITATEVTCSPGEYLLHVTAVRILTDAADAAAALNWPGPSAAAHRGTPTGAALLEASRLAAGLGDVVEALVAAGALSSLSPVPGQLAMLCESLDLRDHGIAALPAAELPRPWLSMLSYVHRRKPDIASPRDGCADVAAALPGVDGVTVSVLGLHASEEGTELHVYLTGLPPDSNPEAYLLPTLWLRDDIGRWHATRVRGMNTAYDGEMTAQLQVLPPLTRCTSLDIVAAGQSGEVRTTVPVRWR